MSCASCRTKVDTFVHGTSVRSDFIGGLDFTLEIQVVDPLQAKRTTDSPCGGKFSAPVRKGVSPVAHRAQEEGIFEPVRRRFSRAHAGPDIRTGGMNEFTIRGNWNEIKGKLKQKYGQLTDDDLMFAKGKEDELLGRLQKKLGRTKDEIRADIEHL